MDLLIMLIVAILVIAIGYIIASVKAKPLVGSDNETLLINEAQGDLSIKYFGIALIALLIDAALSWGIFVAWTLNWIEF